MQDKLIYKDYLIVPVFNYGSKSDFEVFPDSGNEPGHMFASTTIEKIKAWIDAKVEEKELLNDLQKTKI